jgi:hypothetical protein
MKRVAVSLVLVLGAVTACSGGKNATSGFDDSTPDKGDASQGPGQGVTNGDPGGPSLNMADAGAGNGCLYADDLDHDGDGFSYTQGDCNDCDPNVNPGAFDVPASKADEDCNGTPDDDGVACDTGAAIGSVDPFAAAQVLGICRKTDKNGTGKTKTWGVIAAQFVMPDGQSLPAGHTEGFGLLPTFGVNKPQEGGFMLALSSGAARAPGQPNYSSEDNKGYTSGTPAGYPKESPACPGVRTGEAHDGVGLALTIRVPTNAKSFTMQENFFTNEFPIYICSEYNDFFVAMLTPRVPNLPDGNIAFDQQGNPISVNNSLLQVCAPQSAGGKNFACPLGPSSLSKTGFENHAGTGWLQTQAPVTPGSEITLLLAIWDSGDGALDSTVLLDKFTWSADPASGATTVPVPTK